MPHSELNYNLFFWTNFRGPHDPGLTKLRTLIQSVLKLEEKWQKTVRQDSENRPCTADMFSAKFHC